MLSLQPLGPFWGGILGLVGTILCALVPKAHCTLSWGSSDNEKSSRAAASLLGNMWQYNKLHRDFKMVSTSLVSLPTGGILGWILRESRPWASP